ncbi:MAG TPA: hypothetical protein VGR07_21820 [Thermoanaerobaculia bacterium]|jgi:hypothetical protein|nr:hypothetical protein [Thermoanaerobaculia bacterium]
MERPRFPEGPVLTRLADLDRPGVRRETVLRVRSARTVFLDRALLQHDFPRLEDDALARAHPRLRRLTGARRERAILDLLARWLAAHAGLISRPQAAQAVVNSPIRTFRGTRAAHRPADYGRALVMRVPGGALLDIKGTGVAPGRTPSFDSHASGLLFLGEALREVAFGEIVDAVLRHAGSPCRALPVYGVLDLGFAAYLPTPKGRLALPAGLLVRRAHRRPTCGAGLKPPDSSLVALELDVELLLRRYGLTSVGPMTRIELLGDAGATDPLEVRYAGTLLTFDADARRRIRKKTGFAGGKLVLEGVNVQFTRESEADPQQAQLVDFGSYRTRERFLGPLISLVSSRLLRLGAVLEPHHPRFTQPDPALALPDKLLDSTDLPYVLARRFRAGEITGEEVRQALDGVLAATVGRWNV